MFQEFELVPICHQFFFFLLRKPEHEGLRKALPVPPYLAVQVFGFHFVQPCQVLI